MTCVRCGGLLRSERVPGRSRVTLLACMACGDRIDATILANRRGMLRQETHSWKTRVWELIRLLAHAQVPA